MFRTDVPTAAGTLPTPSAPGTPGFFTNGNPALGIPATVVDQDWLNRIQEELTSVLTAAGISPIKSNFSQLLRAIQACNILNDVSASVNVLVANPSPAYSSLVIGTQGVLIPAFTNTTNATLNVSSLGALAVLRPDGTITQPGDLPAGRRVPIIYDGAAWRLINFPTRVRLGGPLTLYCNQQTGNDNNNGLTAGTALGSLQGVWNYLYQNIDTTGQNVAIQCSGNFTQGLLAQTVVVGATPQSITFNFAAGSTVSVANASCLSAYNPGVGFSVTGPVVLSASGTTLAGQGFALFANDSGQIYYGGVNFGSCIAGQVGAQLEGLTYATSNYTISGGSVSHIQAALGGNISIVGVTVTLTGTPAFSNAFAFATALGVMSVLSPASFSGSATGPKYSATLNGVINTNIGVANLPGSPSSGSVATGGQAV